MQVKEAKKIILDCYKCCCLQKKVIKKINTIKNQKMYAVNTKTLKHK